ncbi:MAG: hypothetical protein L0Y55_17605, partial [Anaerolineales bacterium]|nr:hypothetical protein [Anaerolineales bacterium]
MNDRLSLRFVLVALALIVLLAPSHSLRAHPTPRLPAFSSTIYLPFVARSASGPTLAGCPLFPADNIWNARIDALPVHPQSNTYINFIGASKGLHPDFGSGTWDGGPIGIPFNIVPSAQANVPISFYYPGESDPGPYPIPPGALREWGSDHHILILQQGMCLLYEVYDASTSDGGVSWNAGSGAKWNLNSNALRPAGWTSADAAGLSLLNGLVRYDEIVAGEIKHAIRFTVRATNSTHIWHARHLTSSPYNVNAPPMGQRFRLKSSFNISTFSPEVQVILTAFKR